MHSWRPLGASATITPELRLGGWRVCLRYLIHIYMLALDEMKSSKDVEDTCRGEEFGAHN
jgi:hypothetical protein